MVHCCLLWCLWMERNDRQFEDNERSMEELMYFFFFSLYSWTAAFLAPLVISCNDFLVFFPLLSSRSCILPVYLIAFCAFNKKFLTYQKNYMLHI
jgi:hypothetical protein